MKGLKKDLKSIHPSPRNPLSIMTHKALLVHDIWPKVETFNIKLFELIYEIKKTNLCKMLIKSKAWG